MSTQKAWHDGHPEHGKVKKCKNTDYHYPDRRDVMDCPDCHGTAMPAQEQEQEQVEGLQLFNEHQRALRRELHAAIKVAIDKCSCGNDVAAAMQMLSEILGTLIFNITFNHKGKDIDTMKAISQGIDLVTKMVALRASELMAREMVKGEPDDE